MISKEFADAHDIKRLADYVEQQKLKQALQDRAIREGLVPFGSDELRFSSPKVWQGVQIPERSWCVPGFIPDRTPTLLYGDGGSGKSLLVQMLMTSAATGMDWLGQKVDPRRALGFFAEDEIEELARRQANINEAMGLEFENLDRMAWTGRPGQLNLLADFDPQAGLYPTELYEHLLAQAMEFEAGLVIIDTLAETFGGNEVIRNHVQLYLSCIAGNLAREINGAVVLLGHPSVEGMRNGRDTSGSTQWSNGVRSRLTLKRDEDNPEIRILTRAKANYSDMKGEIRLRWDDGFFHVIQPLNSTLSGIEEQNCERVFLEGLEKLLKHGLTPGPSKHSPHYAPKLILEYKLGQGRKLNELKNAMTDLLNSNRIRLAKSSDSKSRQKDVIEIVKWESS
ncbi:MAG: AAA family ATPase [Pseudomonadota bacterium]